MSRLCVALSLLLAASLGAADKAPSWLTELASREVPEYEDYVSGVELLREQIVTVQSDGKVVTRGRGATLVVEPRGRTLAAASVFYRTDSSKILEFNAWIIHPSGEPVELGKKNSADLAISGGDFYNESRVRSIMASGLADPGTVFGYEWVKQDESIFTQLAFQFQGEIPVLTSRYRLELPAGWTAEAVSFNCDEIPVEQQGSSYTWQLHRLEPIFDEPARVPSTAIAPRLAVTYFPSGADDSQGFRDWDSVARWTENLNRPHITPDEAIRAKSRELTAGAAAPLDKMRAIGEFAQDIRYVSIQMGVDQGGGYTPHPASQILENAFGDCKDKVTLIRSLLSAAGIEAYTVLIHSGDRNYVREEWPSPHQFNHVIAGIPVGDGVDLPAVASTRFGRLLFFDPTDPHTEFGELPDYLQGSKALIVDPGGGELATMPASPPESNRLARTVTAEIDARGGISVELSESCHGGSAAYNRRLFHELSGDGYRKMIERWISGSAPGAVIEQVEASERDGRTFGIDVSFTSDEYGQVMGGRLLMFRPSVVSRRGGSGFTDADRRYPVELDSHAYSEVATIRLPEGFVVDEVPEPVTLETEFARYRGEVEESDGALVLRRSLEIDSAIVPAEAYPDVRSFFGQVAGFEDSPVVLLRR